MLTAEERTELAEMEEALKKDEVGGKKDKSLELLYYAKKGAWNYVQHLLSGDEALNFSVADKVLFFSCNTHCIILTKGPLKSYYD